MSKRALCVGINNYPGTGSDLSGCVNDAHDWAAVLTSRGYAVDALLDEEATRASMVAALDRLMRGAAEGDCLVFTYSGHGSWIPDQNGDESDGRDEMLCPYDIARQNYLLDDDLAEIFARKPKGARLFFISDSCHSGTVSRYAPNPLREGDVTATRTRLLPPLEFVKDAAMRRAIEIAARAPSVSRQKYPALLVAGCRDIEYSYDATFDGRPNGAFTRVAIDTLQQNPHTPEEWYALIRDVLPSQAYPQTPQLYGTRADKTGGMF